ncbi:MAG: hypothetical protein AABX05_05545 [Nanoarchaeota archaeon]
MNGKRGQIELAIVKGLALALVVIGGFLIYETIIAKTPEGLDIECKWDCTDADWSECFNGYSYRDINLCVPNNLVCLDSQPKPINVKNC